MYLIHMTEISPELAKNCPAANYVKQFADKQVTALIKNIDVDIYYLNWNGYGMPVCVTNRYIAENSYVVSIYNTYIKYSLAELTIVGLPKPLKWLLSSVINALGLLLDKSSLDKVVYVNNWFISTNLYPANYQPEQCQALTDMLTARFGDHAICFRSLNHTYYPLWIDALKKYHYTLLANRQVYLLDANETSFWQHKSLRHDKRLKQKSHYQTADATALSVNDFKRLQQLYDLLYLNKYCSLNPQFTWQWLNLNYQSGILKLTVLYRSSLTVPSEQLIDGVLGMINQYNVTASPILGYDTTLSPKLGLYRQLNYIGLQQAANGKLLYNLSSGAADFKRVRGAQPAIEYSLIYFNHLGLFRRFRWRLLSLIVNSIGIAVMKVFKL